VNDDLDSFLAHHSSLMGEETAANIKGRLFSIRLPDFPDGRAFAKAWLVLPQGFPQYDRAYIRLSNDAVLRIPHVDYDGDLCLEGGDPGPSSGNATEDRIDVLLREFYLKFCDPWCAGALDGDFGREAMDYWAIQVSRTTSENSPVSKIYTVDTPPISTDVYQARLLLPGRVVIAGNNPAFANRLVNSLSSQKTQIQNVLVADIPIPYELTPSTWPRDELDVDRLLAARLDAAQRKMFMRQELKQKHRKHRIVLLRAPHCSFGLLLTDGPITPINKGSRKFTYPTRQMRYLRVERIDPSWTCGRDQHPQVLDRQKKHVLVLGAGALGSPVIDQLVKAGVGHITIVDPDRLSPANIGRHFLGADSVLRNKAESLAQRITLSNPSVLLTPHAGSAQSWIDRHSLKEVDVVLDLTGEPDVRWHIEQARLSVPCPLLVGWMEPYVAAAHACLLPAGARWIRNNCDPLESLQAVDWPDDVMHREPACNSDFQSYTPAAAAHAVALVSEAALALIDGQLDRPVVRSWVRGQNFIDAHHPDLVLREWAGEAAPFDGISKERSFNE
jgi:hypothetical protein